jgi:uncharacterized protein (TIGR02996 family)
VSDEPFLPQLKLHPDDNVLRLVYADWLDERDDPRGPFLRAAVTLQSLDATDEKVSELRQRILELRPQVSAGWLVRVLREYAEDEVREVVVRAHFGYDRYLRKSFLFVENRADPSWYLFDRLLVDYPDIRPGSAKPRDYYDEESARCWITDLQWEGDALCTVDFGGEVAPQMGSGHRHRVELQNEKWIITHRQQTWIS